MNTPPRKESETGLYAPVWRKINQLIDYLREVQVAHGRNVRVTRTLNGTLLLGEAKNTTTDANPPVRRFRVKEIGYDVIIGNEIGADGSVSTQDTRIAKPFNLRQTGWIGAPVNYPLEDYPGAPASLVVRYSYSSPVYRVASVTTSRGTTQEHQIIVPRYVPQFSQVFAVPVENGTGVDDAKLVDLNADGRAWAKAL